ncbi:MAG TPA: molecular chaperone HtpG, partial [Clostridiaceae bacterium]|nr:molecular chaperone HtpG [Clostridiaceae bacterium]
MNRETGNLSIHTENILPIIKRWLYSDKDIFVREMVSNASDAISKFKRVVSIGEASKEENEKFFIKVIVDKDNKTIQFIDNGIGMTNEEIKKYINQIAFSGASDFIEKYKDKMDEGSQIIGHFGLGFYSAFMVADEVQIDTLSYQEGAGPVKWISSGDTQYEMDVSDRVDRGTTITLYVSEDGEEFLDEFKMREILLKYCAFMPYEIYFENAVTERKKEEEKKNKKKDKKKADIKAKKATEENEKTKVAEDIAEDIKGDKQDKQEKEDKKDKDIKVDIDDNVDTDDKDDTDDDVDTDDKDDTDGNVDTNGKDDIREASDESVQDDTDEVKDDSLDDEEPKPLNDTKPLWLKKPKDCTDEEYKEFYKKVFHDFNDPLFWIHLNMDYPFNLKGILYFPKLKHEFETMEGQIKLYYNQVFVADNIKEVIPEFLMLLKGTIDCPDLPLNVSRSFLQNDGYVNKISNHITRKVADKLVSLFENERENYNKYWDDINPFIKYGCMRESKFYDRVKDIVIYKTTKDDYITLKDYLERNKSKHENKVFYVTDEKQQAQYIKMFEENDLEAVILNVLIDNHFIQFLEMNEKGVTFSRIDSDISESLKDSEKSDTENMKQAQEALESLFKEALGDEKLKVQVENLKASSIPGMILLSEQSRRMQDLSRY